MCSPVSRRRVFCSPRTAPAAIQSDKVTTEAGARPREYFGIRSGVFVEELTVIIFDEENCNPCCGILFRASAVLGVTPKRSGSEFENVSPKRPMFSMVPVVIKRQQKRPWRDIMT